MWQICLVGDIQQKINRIAFNECNKIIQKQLLAEETGKNWINNFWSQEHDTQVRHADCSISYWWIVEGVPLPVCGRNLPLQQLTWSGVMSISAAIHRVHLSTE